MNDEQLRKRLQALEAARRARQGPGKDASGFDWEGFTAAYEEVFAGLSDDERAAWRAEYKRMGLNANG